MRGDHDKSLAVGTRSQNSGTRCHTEAKGYLVPLRATCINYEDIHPFGTNIEKRAQEYNTEYSAVISIRGSI